MATLSILGMYHLDNTILDGLKMSIPKPELVPIERYKNEYVLPETIDYDALISLLLATCAELECQYPEPETFKTVLRAWGTSQRYKWQTLYNTIWLTYNPLVNNWKRLTSEKESEILGNLTGTEKNTNNNDNTRNRNDTSNDNNTRTPNLTTTTENSVSAYNSSSYEPREKTVIQETGTDDVSRETQYNSTENNKTTGQSDTEKEENNKTSSKEKYSETLEANVGVMTSQQLVEAERHVALFSIYETIVSDFKNYFCLLLY